LLIRQLASGSRNSAAPSAIRIQPASVAIIPMTDQPQALSSRPFSVSPMNRVVRSPASFVLFMPPAIHSSLTCE